MSRSDDEVLVRVEGVSKKFCRSLKKSLWYGVCDIASELNPFRGNVAEGARRSKLGAAEGGGEGNAGGNQQADAGDSQSEWSGSFEGPSSSSLGSGPAKTPPDRAPVVPASASSSVLIREFDSLDPSRLALRADLRSLHLAPAPALDCGKKSSAPATSYSPPVTPKASARLLDRHYLCRHRSIPRPRPLPPRYAALDSAHGRVGELTAAAARSR